jgi:3-oxoacyl-[acyl-carrier-protein] synthase-1/3-oxoacyl-[acyl-carrier-protein] synthase II
VLTRASAIAWRAVSPLGEDDAAVDPGAPGDPPRVAIREDAVLVGEGLTRPFAARASLRVGSRDPATGLLLSVLGRCFSDVAARWGPLGAPTRVALVLGTSSGGMGSAERLFRARAAGEPVSAELAAAATYFAPYREALAWLAERGVTTVGSMHLVTACAASTWALGVGLRLLRAGEVDLVLAGGYDALTTFVAAGFESLRATTASRPAPFCRSRDGMSLGEGAGLVALVREGEERGMAPRFLVSGFGASTDAVHVTAPDRSGAGLAQAAIRALSDAELPAASCGLVSAHATSTPFNDAMEARAIQSVFGVERPLVHPFKAQIGHTLGAAGVLETLALARALERAVAPASVVGPDLDPDASVELTPTTRHHPTGAGLKLSAAFGGANASLVVERAPDAVAHVDRRAGIASLTATRPSAASSGRRAVASPVVSVTEVALDRLSELTRLERDKLERLDSLSLLCASAVAELQREVLSPLGRALSPSTGVIVAHSLATVDLNERFYQRILVRGARFAEPRLFPPTSPNLMPGQVAILFQLKGPSAALAGGPGSALDSLTLASLLVLGGDAFYVVVVHVDPRGEASGAILDAAFGGDREDVAPGASACLVTSSGPEAWGSVRSTRGGFGRLALR